MSDEPVRIVLPRRYWLPALIVGVLAVAFFGVATFVFVDQLQTVKEQDVKQAKVVEALIPVLDDASPLLDEAGPLARSARRNRSGALELVARGRRFLVTAQPAVEELPAALDELRGGARAAVSIRDLLAETEALDRLPRDARAVREGLGELRAIGRRTTRFQDRLLALQAEALRRLRNIDERTGGAVTPPGAGTAP